MIKITNDLHGTERVLPDFSPGDVISARQARRIALELCGYSDCNECGILGEHGEQQGFVVVDLGDGSVFIVGLDDDFEVIPTQGHLPENAAGELSERRNSEPEAKNDEKPNPIAQSLERLLELRNHAGDLPHHLAEWLGEAITRYLHGESPTFDQALHLCQPVQGTHSASALHRYARRNECLKRAANLAAPGQRPWPQAKKLAGAIRDYNADILPSGAVYDCIESAHQTELRIPGSVTGLADILCER